MSRPAGVGIGLREAHLTELAAAPERAPPWLEVLADNWLWRPPAALDPLRALRAARPLTLHAVGLNLGGTDPLDLDYVERLRQLSQALGASWISDHLCFTQAGGEHAHELLPLPYTEEAVTHCAARIAEVQDRLGARILIENVSSYLGWADSMLTEAEFVAAVAEAADCNILCDINNIYVSAENHGFAPGAYLEALPAERIAEFHLAGYEDCGSHLLDTHGRPVQPPVWDLYRLALDRLGDVPTLVEWDNDLPPLATLEAERVRAQAIREVALAPAC